MPIESIYSNPFTQEEWATIEGAITAVEELLQSKGINLTPEERKKYGQIQHANLPFVMKMNGYAQSRPLVIPHFEDGKKFRNDYNTFNRVAAVANRSASMMEILSDMKIALSHDIWRFSLACYHNIKFMAGQNVPGMKVMLKDLKQHFQGTARGLDEPSVLKQLTEESQRFVIEKEEEQDSE